MTNFTFNNAVPASGNNPSNDQPDMLINNISTDGILAIDHISFNTNDGGTHKQVNFINKFVQPAQTDPSSVLYTVSGTASTKADMRFKNENGTFPVNALRAFGVLTTISTAGVNVPVALDMGMNIGSIVANSNGQIYTIPITAGATTGTTVIVDLNLSNDGTKTWTFAANTLTVTINAGSTGSRKLSFFVYQV